MCRRIDIIELEYVNKLDYLIVQEVLHTENDYFNIHLSILSDLLDMSAAIYQRSDLLLHDVTGYFNNLVIASFSFVVNEYGDIPLPDLRRFFMFGLELEVEGVEVVKRDAEAASPDHFPCVQPLINIGYKFLHVPLFLLIPEHVMVYLHYGKECCYLPE